MSQKFIPATKLQRESKAVFAADTPFQIVLKGSEVNGIVVNKQMAEMLLNSDVLEQLEEELLEAQDTTTVNLIQAARAGKPADSASLSDFRATHDL